MTEFDSKGDRGGAAESNNSPDLEKLIDLRSSRLPLIPPSKLVQFVEGVVGDELLEIGACDPDITDYLTGIQVDGLLFDNLMPVHPQSNARFSSVHSALLFAQERDNFRDGYAFVEFQDSIGRVILFATSRTEKSHHIFLAPEDTFRHPELTLLGKKCYFEAALEAFDLRDQRTALWQILGEDFELMQHVMRKVSERFARPDNFQF